MSASPSISSAAPVHNRWFYSIASFSLLVVMFIGFRLFYLQGQAYPGRPLAEPIRTLIITHGCLMTVWMLLAVGQPLLVATRHKALHMKLGILGLVLAVLNLFVGLRVGIESARIAPPELRLFGLAPKEFMAVPLGSIVIFGLFVLAGILNRRRPYLHRPMMLLASVAVVGAALGRITVLNELYAGTWLEVVFTAFLMDVLLATLLLGVKCVLSRSFDKWFASGVAALVVASLAISLGSRTKVWDQIATLLLR